MALKQPLYQTLPFEVDLYHCVGSTLAQYTDLAQYIELMELHWPNGRGTVWQFSWKFINTESNSNRYDYVATASFARMEDLVWFKICM